MSTRFMPVFTGGIFKNNEIILPYGNFVFSSEEELKEANERVPFISFFPFPVIFSKVLEVGMGSWVDGVEITFSGSDAEMLCISGEWYDSGE